MKKRPDTRRRRGFTLIELLVVIAIIAILAAILFPVFAQAREKARQAACLSNGKQIATGLMMYAQDYDERLPRWWTPTGGQNNQSRDWKNDIEPYVKNWDIYRCPSRNTQWPGYGYNAFFATDTGVAMPTIQFTTRQLLVADVRPEQPNGKTAVDRSLPTGCKFPNGDLRFQAEARHMGGLRPAADRVPVHPRDGPRSNGQTGCGLLHGYGQRPGHRLLLAAERDVAVEEMRGALVLLLLLVLLLDTGKTEHE
jgi:prepilin-type N-terminal cleavage/methylation domain-containing protein